MELQNKETKEQDNQSKVDFEELLDHIGGWGKFQIRLTVIFVYFTFFLAYVGYTPILYLYTPEHWCKIPDEVGKQLNISDQNSLMNLMIPKDKDGKRSQCEMYNYTDFKEGLKPRRIGCIHGYEYNYTEYFKSATSQFDWVCQEEWKPAFTQSMFYAGAIIGTLIFGYVSDQFGRFWSFMVSNIVIMVTGLATPFAFNFLSFTILRFAMGLGFNTFFIALYMLAVEYVDKKKRALVGNLALAIAMSIGGCIQPWILYAVGDWRWFHHILFGQTVLIFAAPYFIKESSRWLVTKGKIDQAIDTMLEIAQENGKTVSPTIVQSFKASAEQEYEKGKATKLTLLDLFKTPILRRNVLLMIINWSLTSILFDAHIRNIDSLQYSIYWTFTISSFIELPADLLSIWGLEIIGRRWSAVVSLVAFSITMFVSTIIIDNVLWLTILAMLGRGFITYSINTAAQISLEVVPTELRGQGSALANVCAQVSMFFAPQVVFSRTIDFRLPFVILGFGSGLAGIFALFLPETANTKLPDTIAETNELYELSGCCVVRKQSVELENNEVVKPESV